VQGGRAYLVGHVDVVAVGAVHLLAVAGATSVTQHDGRGGPLHAQPIYLRVRGSLTPRRGACGAPFMCRAVCGVSCVSCVVCVV
jgi:hypothetical protein